MTFIKVLALVCCLQCCVTAIQSGDEFTSPCNNSNIDVKKCNGQLDHFVSTYMQGPDLQTAMAAMQQIAAPPYKKCSLDLQPPVDGVSVKRSGDYCEWYTKDANGNQQKNIFLSFEIFSMSYSCVYDAPPLEFTDGFQSVLNSKVLSISHPSCKLPDDIPTNNIQLDEREHFVQCLQSSSPSGWFEKGTVGGLFQNLPIIIQYHIVNKRITVDKMRVNGVNFLATSTRSCEGDDGFKAICNCFQRSKMYDSAVKLLVNSLLSCTSKRPEIICCLENMVCTDG